MQQEPTLVEVYYKRQDGLPLTDAEQAMWDDYRNMVPVEKALDPDAMEKLARFQANMPPAEEFFKKYNIPYKI